MRIIKPKQLSLLYKVYEEGSECRLMVAVMGMFSFDRPSTILPEGDLWAMVGETIGKESPIDMIMPKPVGEIVVAGKCFAPGGKPVESMDVSVNMGPIHKTIRVTGDRFWRKSSLGGFDMTNAKAFTEMPITWQNAFGGDKHESNLQGKGFPTDKMKAGKVPWPLPNIENRNHLIQKPEDNPPPACLLPLDIMSPKRMSKLGTYDNKWKKEKFPGFPEDMDWTYFNISPEDQWWEGFFKGTEKFEISGMHPEKPMVSSNLPGIGARCFMTREREPKKLEELETRLDTVFIFPETEAAIALFRADVIIDSDDATDIPEFMAGFEKLDQPKSSEHYEDTFARWTHPEHASVYQLKEEDLLPQGEPVTSSDIQKQIEEVTDIQGIASEKMKANAEKKLGEAKDKIKERFDKLKSLGVDIPLPGMPEIPDTTIPETKKMSTDDFINFATQDREDLLSKYKELAKIKLAEAEEKKKEVFDKLKKMSEKHGLDYEEMLKKAEAGKKKGAPLFKADDVMEKFKKFEKLNPASKKALENAGVNIEEQFGSLKDAVGKGNLAEKLKMAEKNSADMYRKFAHKYPPSEPLDPYTLEQLKKQLLEGKEEGKSFYGWDLTGVDLAGLDLSGIDLNNTFLEGANLAGCNFTGANLARTVLTRANLSGCDFTGAKLMEANIGEANLYGAKLSPAGLTGVVIEKSDCTGADFSGGDLGGIDVNDLSTSSPVELAQVSFNYTKLTGANFSKISAKSAFFLEADLEGANFSGASLTKATFIKSNLNNADFSETSMSGSTVIESEADGISFSGAHLEGVALVKGTSMQGANFSNAKINRSNLREANLEKANFTKSLLDESDFSESDMKGADLSFSSATRTRFQKTDLTGAVVAHANLTEALMMKTILHDTDLTGSNLFGAELIKAKINDKTNFRNANLKRTKIEESEEPEKQ